LRLLSRKGGPSHFLKVADWRRGGEDREKNYLLTPDLKKKKKNARDGGKDRFNRKWKEAHRRGGKKSPDCEGQQKYDACSWSLGDVAGGDEMGGGYNPTANRTGAIQDGSRTPQ